METLPAFELPNVGVGPDPLSLSGIDGEVDFVILFLLRDYRCPKCKTQVQCVAERAPELERRNAAPIAILPESRERAERWQAEFDLPSILDDLRASFEFDCALVEC
ncbi:MAG: redoxin domain-containing protein [Halapricum sp.]